jgi:hypothetical protein
MSDEEISGEALDTEVPPETQPETVIEEIETLINQGVQWITRNIESL